MKEETELPCEQKMTFDSAKDAQKTALTAKWQHGVRLKPYRCKHCQLWHLASDTSKNND